MGMMGRSGNLKHEYFFARPKIMSEFHQSKNKSNLFIKLSWIISRMGATKFIFLQHQPMDQYINNSTKCFSRIL